MRANDCHYSRTPSFNDFQNDGSRFVLTHELLTSPAIVEPEDYAGLLKVQAALGRKSERTLLLQAADTEPPKATP